MDQYQGIAGHQFCDGMRQQQPYDSDPVSVAKKRLAVIESQLGNVAKLQAEAAKLRRIIAAAEDPPDHA